MKSLYYFAGGDFPLHPSSVAMETESPDHHFVRVAMETSSTGEKKSISQYGNEKAILLQRSIELHPPNGIAKSLTLALNLGASQRSNSATETNLGHLSPQGSEQDDQSARPGGKLPNYPSMEESEFAVLQNDSLIHVLHTTVLSKTQTTETTELLSQALMRETMAAQSLTLNHATSTMLGGPWHNMDSKINDRIAEGMANEGLSIMPSRLAPADKSLVADTPLPMGKGQKLSGRLFDSSPHLDKNTTSKVFPSIVNGTFDPLRPSGSHVGVTMATALPGDGSYGDDGVVSATPALGDLSQKVNTSPLPSTSCHIVKCKKASLGTKRYDSESEIVIYQSVMPPISVSMVTKSATKKSENRTVAVTPPVAPPSLAVTPVTLLLYDLTIAVDLKGNCSILRNASTEWRVFVDRLLQLLRKPSAISKDAIRVDRDAICDKRIFRVIVTLMNVTLNATWSLQGAAYDGKMSFDLLDSLNCTHRYNISGMLILAIKSPDGVVRIPGESSSYPDGLLGHFDRLILIIAAIVLSTLFLSGFVLCVREFHRHRFVKSFDLSAESSEIDLKLEEYTLTTLPRPKSVYSDEGLVLQLPLDSDCPEELCGEPANQGVLPLNIPIGETGTDSMSKSDYLDPELYLKSYPVKTISTENLVKNSRPPSGAGLVNPSFVDDPHNP